MNVFGNFDSIPLGPNGGGQSRARKATDKAAPRTAVTHPASPVRTASSGGAAMTPRPVRTDFRDVADPIDSSDSQAAASAVASLVRDLDGFRRSHLPQVD